MVGNFRRKSRDNTAPVAQRRRSACAAFAIECGGILDGFGIGTVYNV